MQICLCWAAVLIPNLNPIQAGVFWNPGGQGTLCPLPLFLLYLWSNYNQTWHDGTLGQNLSKPIKILLMSSPGGKFDIIKPFLVAFRGLNLSSLIFCPMELKFGTGVNSEALISNSSQKIQYKYVLKEKKAIFLRKIEIFAQALLDKNVAPRLLSTENYFK